MMSQRPSNDEQLSDQPISQRAHDENRFEDRGTTDAVGRDAGNDPGAAAEGQRSGDRPVAAGEDQRDQAPKKAARTVGTAAGMFFPVLILALIALVLIVYLLVVR
jgi:hypothetical protein